MADWQNAYYPWDNYGGGTKAWNMNDSSGSAPHNYSLSGPLTQVSQSGANLAYEDAGKQILNAGSIDPNDPYAAMMQNMMSGQFGTSDPSYGWRFEQGQQAVERSLAARGLLNSGNAAIELQAYGQGMASTEYQAQFERLLKAMGLYESGYQHHMSTLASLAGVTLPWSLSLSSEGNSGRSGGGRSGGGGIGGYGGSGGYTAPSFNPYTGTYSSYQPDLGGGYGDAEYSNSNNDSGYNYYSSTDGTSSNYGPWYTNPNFGTGNTPDSGSFPNGAWSDSYYSNYNQNGGQVYPDYSGNGGYEAPVDQQGSVWGD